MMRENRDYPVKFVRVKAIMEKNGKKFAKNRTYRNHNIQCILYSHQIRCRYLYI